MQDERADFPPGKIIRARYIVEELLGKGGFGAVYRVRERRMSSNIFALKEVIDPNRQQRERFTFEGEILQRLDHPALPRVYQLFEDRKHHRLYMLMDYIEGVDLEQLRQQQPGKRFTLAEAMRIMAPIADALIYLHAQQPPVMHRDIKPANIIVSPLDDRAVLVDFGIAKEYDQEATTTAVRHCSPGYGAPEQYALGTNPRTDIYGLAATFYKLLTGQVPVDAFYRLTRLGSGANDPLEPVNMLIPTIPSSVADVLRRAMAINSNDRFASIEEFWQALQICTTELRVPDITIGTQEPVSQRLSPIVSAASALSPLVVSARSYVSTVRTRRSKQATGRRAVFLTLVALVLVGLISGSIFGVGKWSGLGPAYDVVIITPQSTPPIAIPRLRATATPSLAASPLATLSPTVPPTTIAATPTPTPGTRSTATALTPTPAPTARPTVSSLTPTATPPVQPLPPDYPVLANHYNGVISDQYSFPFKNASMVLSQIRQDGEKVSGYFSSASGFIGAGSFSGTLSADNLIQFILPGSTLLHPFFFQGQLQADGSILGTYCSLQNNHCNFFAGEYGNWKVMPLSR
ncbi:MAG TPA: protein kinase [Ktedonosporobacter sp.]|jgi:predicted Ser/Thr protein kinase|nr:protein kinase [Ktedonosporobacter sp.]